MTSKAELEIKIDTRAFEEAMRRIGDDFERGLSSCIWRDEIRRPTRLNDKKPLPKSYIIIAMTDEEKSAFLNYQQGIEDSVYPSSLVEKGLIELEHAPLSWKVSTFGNIVAENYYRYGEFLVEVDCEET